MLEINNLIKNYGKKEAVKKISLSVKPGEIYGFLGHNGAGKTTTIKVCTGLLKPSSGSVRICGYDIVSEPLEAKKNFGYVPENPYLFDKLTGRELLDMVSGIYMKDKRYSAVKRIDELLKELQMTDEADKLIGAYSHGMRRKITICAALIHNPSVIFLDEPTTGLDASSAKAAKDLFRKHADEGSAILFTTHVLEIAERLCDRIGIIYQGELIAEGTFEELKERSEYPGTTLEDIFLNLTNKNRAEG
ncbi:ABC transporter ATP-binding protein [Candidatus Contubernalis alkaliaceticus]|uniref:ABC transporter ATP-binding protein n=1 Tax=Candidatus Contubernalis alkaliaceticus TaxID=338645 RepID=UPI001F4C4A22|nr:ABC transporter ATP-binding protein [Candidatus Contubernalis alkalaceticus]UNC90823.1 ABC transporter ATP-binding protein [Candidatus Contubernalis alkalaceticus]